MLQKLCIFLHLLLFVGLEPEIPNDNFIELKSSYDNMFLLFVNNQKFFLLFALRQLLTFFEMMSQPLIFKKDNKI